MASTTDEPLPSRDGVDNQMPPAGSTASGPRSAFWEEARREMDGLPGGRGLNMAHEAVDRHVPRRGDRTAFRFLAKDGGVRQITYRQLADESARFAATLQALGVEPGATVFLLAGRIPELYVAALGALKARCVVSPLFAAFGPEPIRARMEPGEARVLVTTPTLFRRKVEGWWRELPSLEHVLLTGPEEGAEGVEGARSLRALLRDTPPLEAVPDTDPQDPALLHFTSGTTGTPKGALHVHEAVVAHHVTGRIALDLRPNDTFWCTADPGWVTGTSYGIVSPLTNGVTSVVDEREFHAERWYRTLQDRRVNVWYTAPTAIRMLMKAGDEMAQQVDLSHLRFIASVGEPLNPEAVEWGREVLGIPIRDNWWQTETGGIMIANHGDMEIRPGSMGRPLPGVEAAVARPTEDSLEWVEPGEEGELVLRAGWPSMFRGYLHQEERYRSCFRGPWYLSGDLVRRDDDGYFWFVGRADDVIKSAGHLIGPFEVESALVEHPAVAEAAVIGKPDPVIGEAVKAYVAVRTGHEADEELRLSILGHVRSRLGAAVAPREIDFVDDLPKTKSGKIMRRLLKARELGLPEGDLSTLEREP